MRNMSALFLYIIKGPPLVPSEGTQKRCTKTKKIERWKLFYSQRIVLHNGLKPPSTINSEGGVKIYGRPYLFRKIMRPRRAIN